MKRLSSAWGKMLEDALKKDGNFPAYPEESRVFISDDQIIAAIACPKFIPFSIIFPRKPSGFRV